jgi:Fe-S-cluster containining protein
VPCGTCHACCYHQRIDVYPVQEPAERLAHLDIVADPRGGVQLNKRSDGACIHLTEQGKCGVYEYRPTACRKYDCRLFAFIGLALQHDDEHIEPVWQFDIRTTDDKIMKAAIMFLGVEYRKTHTDPVDPIEMSSFIAEHLDQAKELMAGTWKVEEQMVQKKTRNERKIYHREMEAMANSQ